MKKDEIETRSQSRLALARKNGAGSLIPNKSYDFLPQG